MTMHWRKVKAAPEEAHVTSSFVNNYRFIRRFNKGLIGLASSHGADMFTIVKLRKTKPCALCKVELQPKQRAYAPITNGYNRMHRICVACVAELEKSYAHTGS